ncbi:hypothetical protein NDU88_003371 [Pleurodeles waltl]|uniref:Uncharacterized protein n=1 Tax=Pleurodeles waltl TaxID=8319 RepID=A0AAV7MQI9_PLEWA|nr:hypothetical protein NDU88_003371 [Pleurodeles waltl]
MNGARRAPFETDRYMRVLRVAQRRQQRPRGTRRRKKGQEHGVCVVPAPVLACIPAHRGGTESSETVVLSGPIITARMKRVYPVQFLYLRQLI